MICSVTLLKTSEVKETKRRHGNCAKLLGCLVKGFVSLFWAFRSGDSIFETLCFWWVERSTEAEGCTIYDSWLPLPLYHSAPFRSSRSAWNAHRSSWSIAFLLLMFGRVFYLNNSNSRGPIL